MKKAVLYAFGVLMLAAIGGVGQPKTVTNADLEKYRSIRLKAEQDYRENYQKLGLPSPEELERQRDQDARESQELSARLRNDRLLREQAEFERKQATGFSIASQQQYLVVDGNYGSRPIYGYTYYGNRWNNQRWPNHRNQVIYRATPGGVIYEPGGRSSYVWSLRNTRPRPAFRFRR